MNGSAVEVDTAVVDMPSYNSRKRHETIEVDKDDDISEIIEELLDGKEIIVENNGKNSHIPRLIGRKLSQLRRDGALSISRDDRLGVTRMLIREGVSLNLDKGVGNWFDRVRWNIRWNWNF